MHCFPVDYIFHKGIYLHFFPVEFRSMIGSSYAAVQGEAGAFEIKLGSHLPGYHKNCGLHWVPGPKMPGRSCHLALQAGANWSTAPQSAARSRPAGTWS